MTRILFTPQAERDLEEIGDYIAADNPTRAQSFVQEIREHCINVAAAPLAYVARPDLGDNLRVCSHGRYRIFFRVGRTDASVLIVRVLHGARDLMALFREPSDL